MWRKNKNSKTTKLPVNKEDFLLMSDRIGYYSVQMINQSLCVRNDSQVEKADDYQFHTTILLMFVIVIMYTAIIVN